MKNSNTQDIYSAIELSAYAVACMNAANEAQEERRSLGGGDLARHDRKLIELHKIAVDATLACAKAASRSGHKDATASAKVWLRDHVKHANLARTLAENLDRAERHKAGLL